MYLNWSPKSSFTAPCQAQGRAVGWCRRWSLEHSEVNLSQFFQNTSIVFDPKSQIIKFNGETTWASWVSIERASKSKTELGHSFKKSFRRCRCHFFETF